MNRIFTSTGNGARNFNLAIIFLVILVLIGTFFYFFLNYTLFQVYDVQNEQIVYRRLMKVNETFTLEFTHSVTKRPVYEVYYVKTRNNLAVKEMRFDEFGPNLPAGPETFQGETTEFVVEDGKFKVLYENRILDTVTLRTGKEIANHTLIFEDGTEVPFLEITPGGSLVEYYVKPIVALQKGG